MSEVGDAPFTCCGPRHSSQLYQHGGGIPLPSAVTQHDDSRWLHGSACHLGLCPAPCPAHGAGVKMGMARAKAKKHIQFKQQQGFITQLNVLGPPLFQSTFGSSPLER